MFPLRIHTTTPDEPLALLVATVALAWVMIMTAGVLHARGWTVEGMQQMFDNREDVPPAKGLAGRARRASVNMNENLLLFAPLLVAALLAHPESQWLVPGAWVFFVARLVYFPVYLAGIIYVRTALWAVGIVGIALVGAAVLGL